MDFSYLLESGNYNAVQDRHTRFDVRAESFSNAEAAEAVDANRETNSISFNVIESVLTSASTVRLTGIMDVSAGSSFSFGKYNCGHEILLLDGDLLCTTETDEYKANSRNYLRIPYGKQTRFASTGGCRMLIKLGQLSDTDHEPRLISTDDQNLWLPGPTDGTQVLPLHLHDTKNVLLIRWDLPAYFKPQLDPLGEELFVVDGTLHDAFGSYESGSWIRNPVPAWQSWGGHAGTMVYYKNGHFPEA